MAAATVFCTAAAAAHVVAFARPTVATNYQCTVNASLGCYVDDNENRILAHTATMGDPAVTLEYCAALCAEAGYAGGINGVEYVK